MSDRACVIRKLAMDVGEKLVLVDRGAAPRAIFTGISRERVGPGPHSAGRGPRGREEWEEDRGQGPLYGGSL
jgi:hypothetical protein